MSDEGKKEFDWNNVADVNSANFVDEILESEDKLTMEQKLAYLNLSEKRFLKLPANIRCECMTDDVLEYWAKKERKSTMLNKLLRQREEKLSNYGIKKYKRKYIERDVPLDYSNKAKFILDNLKFDNERYKACQRTINGKTKLVCVGIRYYELEELVKNLKYVSLFLKSKKYTKFHNLVREMYLNGLSNIKYGEKFNLDRGSVEHQKKKLFNVFADFLAQYDIATNAVDEIISGDMILDSKYFESAELKMKIFEMLEEAKILDKIIDEEMKKDFDYDSTAKKLC